MGISMHVCSHSLDQRSLDSQFLLFHFEISGGRIGEFYSLSVGGVKYLSFNVFLEFVESDAGLIIQLEIGRMHLSPRSGIFIYKGNRTWSCR